MMSFRRNLICAYIESGIIWHPGYSMPLSSQFSVCIRRNISKEIFPSVDKNDITIGTNLKSISRAKTVDVPEINML